MCLLVNWLNCGNTNITIINATVTDNITINKASPINWRINDERTAPTTFLTPTSFERLTACAVARFIKLTQAISTRKSAINSKAKMSDLLNVCPPNYNVAIPYPDFRNDRRAYTDRIS